MIRLVEVRSKPHVQAAHCRATPSCEPLWQAALRCGRHNRRQHGAGDVGMPQERFQGLRSGTAGAKIAFDLPIRLDEIATLAHVAVVELVTLENAEIKYSTVQNWYPGDEEGKGGIYNFVTKRGDCRGNRSRISWTQVETGSAITWKYPSCILRGDDTCGEFYSVALTTNSQQADTGTKMIHLGRNTRSKIISKGISAGHGQNTYRGLVKVSRKADNARNFTQCDSMLIGKNCGAHTFPYIEAGNPTAKIEHEATTSRIGEDQLFYCLQRGISEEDAVSMIVDGFCKQVFRELPNAQQKWDLQKGLITQLAGL